MVLPLIPQQGMSYIYNCYCTKLMVVFITTSSFFFLMARRGHLLFAPSKMRSTWQGLLETGSTRRGGRESPRLIEIIGSRFGVTRCSHIYNPFRRDEGLSTPLRHVDSPFRRGKEVFTSPRHVDNPFWHDERVSLPPCHVDNPFLDVFWGPVPMATVFSLHLNTLYMPFRYFIILFYYSTCVRVGNPVKPRVTRGNPY